jgi:hypothetical protein
VRCQSRTVAEPRDVLLLTIGEDDIDHADEHPVLCRVTGVLDDGDNVGPLLGHVDEISSTSVRELDSVYGSLGSDNVGNVGYRGTAVRARNSIRIKRHQLPSRHSSSARSTDSRSSSEVEHLGTRLDVDVVETSQDTSSKLASEGVPYSELGLVLAAIWK